MSIRLDMLGAARLSARMLGDSADQVRAFLRGRMNNDGGFKNRAGVSDVYYTVFGLEALIVLGDDTAAEAVAAYLKTLRDGEGLDLVHLACLARCWADLPKQLSEGAPRGAMLERLRRYRAADGAYNASAGAERGTAYASFLAVGAHEDLGLAFPDPDAVVMCLQRLRAEDGGYANQPGSRSGLTPVTAAAATLLRRRRQNDEVAAKWLLSRFHPRGGFVAAPAAPTPDLLSTATALHALAGMGVDLAALKEPCLAFIQSLWSGGGFLGHWADDEVDCEYTYYALLALGHLSAW